MHQPKNVFVRGALLSVILAAALATTFSPSAAEEPKTMRFSKFCFFGYQALDLARIEAAMPFKVGVEIEQTPQAMADFQNRIGDAVEAVTGKRTTDVAPVYFQQSWTAYIGLPGTSSQTIIHNPKPSEKIELPAPLVKTYQETMDANVHALETGQDADRKKYDQLREQSRQQAKDIPDKLMHVLASSADPMQRRVAAHCLGLIARTEKQINALSAAGNDADDGVRNDAVRALSMIAYDDHKTARLIPAQLFIKLLSSGTWTDRNKGSFLLCGLIKNRQPKLIDALRQQSIPALKEIASWDPGHAQPALQILGVMAGIPDDKLNQLITADKKQEIIEALK